MVLQDAHSPFIDTKLFTQIIKLCKDLDKINLIILNGDMADMPQISRFKGDPKRLADVQYEADLLHSTLNTLRNANPNSNIIYNKGNHEERLEKYLYSRAPELSSIRSLQYEELLRLNKLDIKYNRSFYRINSNLIARHGHRCGKLPANGEIQIGCNGISGHAHKSNRAVVNELSRQLQWHSLGHLADINQLKELYAEDFGHTWNQSFALIEFDTDNFYVNEVFVDNDGFYCSYNGRYYAKN